MQQIDSGLTNAVYYFYDSWSDAIEDSGVPFTYTRTVKWGPEKVIEEIKKRDKEKKGLRYKKTAMENNKLVHAAKRYFGAWEKAVEAAGFNYDEIRLKRTKQAGNTQKASENGRICYH